MIAWECEGDDTRGITVVPRSPVRTSRQPMTSGISTTSPAICLRRAFTSAFSGDPATAVRLFAELVNDRTHLLGTDHVRTIGSNLQRARFLAAAGEPTRAQAALDETHRMCADALGDQWSFASLGLIMGGTVGNGFDRIVHGTVTDFINFHFWPVFNVADSAICIGVAGLAYTVLFPPRRPDLNRPVERAAGDPRTSDV